MKALIAITIASITFSGTAYAETAPPKPTKLISAYYKADDVCRGTYSEKTDAACALRDTTVDNIAKKGWCYGKDTDEATMYYKWHVCTPDSHGYIPKAKPIPKKKTVKAKVVQEEVPPPAENALPPSVKTAIDNIPVSKPLDTPLPPITTSAQKESIDYLVNRHGFSADGAAGIIAGLTIKSDANLLTHARINDDAEGTYSVGLGYWNNLTRITNGRKFLGKPLESATRFEQLDFMVHELDTTHKHALAATIAAYKTQGAQGATDTFLTEYFTNIVEPVVAEPVKFDPLEEYYAQKEREGIDKALGLYNESDDFLEWYRANRSTNTITKADVEKYKTIYNNTHTKEVKNDTKGSNRPDNDFVALIVILFIGSYLLVLSYWNASKLTRSLAEANRIIESNNETYLAREKIYQEAIEELNNNQPTGELDKYTIKRIIQLCHPDKHNNSVASNEVTEILLKLLSDKQNKDNQS